MPHQYDPNQPRVPQGHQGGGQWTRGALSSPRTALLRPRPPVIQKPDQTTRPPAKGDLRGAVALWEVLSNLNSASRRAVITFRAREYRLTDDKKLDVERIQYLDGNDVDQICPCFKQVQSMTDEAAKKITENNAATGTIMSPQQYGSAVHAELKRKIGELGLENLKGEISKIKTKSETGEDPPSEKEFVDYGYRGSVRIDVYETVRREALCLYDVKTGKRNFTPARMEEIGRAFAKSGMPRLILIEVRPYTIPITAADWESSLARCRGGFVAN